MWAMVALCSLVVPAVAMLAVAEWIMRASERRERIRAAREGARRTTLGVRWTQHQEQREAARELREKGGRA
jgi:hypothetical protein